MSTLDEYSQLVSSIYDAALDFEKWPVVIERLSDALGGNGGGLATHNLVTGGGALVIARRDPIFTRLYAEHYSNVNVLFDRVGRVPAETCVTDRDIMPKEELRRTEFYNDFLRPQDEHTSVTAYVLSDDDWRVTLNIGRSPRRGEWERQHVDLMRYIAPHLHRAAQINLRLGAARFDEESSAEVLDHLACGVIIVSGDGRALFANRAAEAIVAAADGIRLD